MNSLEVYQNCISIFRLDFAFSLYQNSRLSLDDTLDECDKRTDCQSTWLVTRSGPLRPHESAQTLVEHSRRLFGSRVILKFALCCVARNVVYLFELSSLIADTTLDGKLAHNESDDQRIP